MKKLLLIATTLVISATITSTAAFAEDAATETPVASHDEAKHEAAPEAKHEDGTYVLHIKDHTFTPDELHVPAGKKFKLIVHNDDPTPEEFESDDFRREKIIPGNSKATIQVGPLEPGKYEFFGEFNEDTAKGYLYAE